MIEARAFVDDILPFQERLHTLRAQRMGSYTQHDQIFRRKDDTDINEDFLRIRHMPDNIWDRKPYSIEVKKTVVQTLGKKSLMPTSIDFTLYSRAYQHFSEHFSEDYVLDFEFSRTGEQYALPGTDVADLEIVEGEFHTVEVKSKTNTGIATLLNQLAIPQDSVIVGPSVSKIRELLDIPYIQ